MTKKLLLLTAATFLMFISNVGIGFAQERNPFLQQLPLPEITISDDTHEQPIIVYNEPEKIFDVSLYNLQGVVWGAYESRAIINNKIFAVGDVLGEGKIVKIGKEGVTVLFEDEEYVIRTKNIALDRSQSPEGGYDENYAPEDFEESH